ncbi:hypothetical protein L2E82_30587 [Cichorium intybus]|uniref:Uncharacterized protein n=1 Tax=Cichorium intybus TaxID=13427 RepID=A0ACB9D148_CICIN|nr:hypothetical protein L2E82_30587 [Cichorium intybus]
MATVDEKGYGNNKESKRKAKRKAYPIPSLASNRPVSPIGTYKIGDSIFSVVRVSLSFQRWGERSESCAVMI